MRRYRKYVVSFDNDMHPVYGLDCDCRDWIDPLNMTEAKKKLKELEECEYIKIKSVIYELVPIKSRSIGKR